MKGSQINCRPFIILIFIAMVMMVFAEAYPASYPGYYPPAGLEEQNYNYANLQQAIERIREAFLQNNEIENIKYNIDPTISDLLQLLLSKELEDYPEELKLMLISNMINNKTYRGNYSANYARSSSIPAPSVSSESDQTYSKVRRSPVNCQKLWGGLALDLGTKVYDSGNIQNCYMSRKHSYQDVGR